LAPQSLSTLHATQALVVVLQTGVDPLHWASEVQPPVPLLLELDVVVLELVVVPLDDELELVVVPLDDELVVPDVVPPAPPVPVDIVVPLLLLLVV
jgi:hypothetical protein